jgi:hypothetical protein
MEKMYIICVDASKTIIKQYAIFGGMHIHLPANVMFTRFDPYPCKKMQEVRKLTALFELALIRRLL